MSADSHAKIAYVSSQSRCLKKDKNSPCDFKHGSAAQ